MKHRSRYVPAVLSVMLSFSPPVCLLADTGPFLSNSEATLSSDLNRADPESSFSNVFDQQQKIILAFNTNIFKSIGKGAGKAVRKAEPPVKPPRPKPKGEADANDLPSPPKDTPGSTGARTNEGYKPIMAPPEKVPPLNPVIYDRYIPKNALQYTSLAPQPRSTPRALKVVKWIAITTLIGGTLVAVGVPAYAGLIAGGLIEPIPGDDVFGPLRPQSNE